MKMGDMYGKRKDYTLRNGKDASMANRRHGMEESQHDGSNSFVRAEQHKTKHMGGKEPRMDGRYMEFDACMVNNGEHAQEFAKELTKGIDHEAFPVRQRPDRSQE